MKRALAAWLAVTNVLLSGCATILSDSSTVLHLESEPNGASVYVHGKLIGTTPLKVSLPKENGNTYAVFKKQGFTTSSVKLEKGVATSAWFNVVFITTTSGAPSWGIDFLTGKMFKYQPDSYVVSLRKGDPDGSLPRVSPLEYAVENYERIRKDIARGTTRELKGFCPILEYDEKHCADFVLQVQRHKGTLLSRPNGLALYRDLKKLEAWE